MCQVVPQTREEKVAMYMKCKKKELAEMMANRNIWEDILKETEPTQTITTAGDTQTLTIELK